MRKPGALVYTWILIVALTVLFLTAPIYYEIRVGLAALIVLSAAGATIHMIRREEGEFDRARIATGDFLFGGDRTLLVGTVIMKRTDMGDDYELYTEYPRTHYYMRISATELEVPKRIYESVHEGWEVVLVFRGRQAITDPKEMKSRQLVSIKPHDRVALQQWPWLKTNQDVRLSVIEERKLRYLR